MEIKEQFKIPTHIEVEGKVKELLDIMVQREIGLFTWQQARATCAQELFEMLKRVGCK